MLRMFAVLALFAVVAQAQEVTLKVGDDAPPLSIAKWVKGGPVTIEKGKIYVVEFWATWCAPCILSMPHLSELQEMSKDKVTFVSVTNGDPRNTIEAVEKMVSDRGDGMGYTVAWDDAGKTTAAYMAASGQQSIPCAFVVGADGKIAHISVGYPGSIDIPLALLAAGKWDAAKGSEQIVAVQHRLGSAFRTRSLDELGAIEKDLPGLAPMLGSAKFQLLLVAGKFEDASALGTKLVEKAAKFKNAMLLNEVSWSIVDPGTELKTRDLELAMKAAQQATELTGAKDPAILDTLARVHYLKGDLTKAIELETKAVELVGDHDGELLQGLKAALEQYKSEAAAKQKAQ